MCNEYTLELGDIDFDQSITCKVDKTEDGKTCLKIQGGYNQINRSEHDDEILTINFVYVEDTLDRVEIIFEHDYDTDVILTNDSLNEHLVDSDVFSMNICKLTNNLITLSFTNNEGEELVLYYKGNPLSLP